MTMLALAEGLAGLVGVGIIFIGGRFLVAPSVAAAGYGVAVAQGSKGVGAYLSAKGVGDFISGVFVFILIASGTPHVLGLIIAAAALIPIGDAVIVLRNHGSRLTAFAIHGVTAVVMLAISALLLIPPA